MKSDISLQILQQAVASGNHSAFESLYALYRTEFIRFGCNKTGCSTEECADAFQEAIVALYENIREKRLLELHSSIKTYIFTIGKFKLLNLIKKKSLHSNFCSHELINGNTIDFNSMEKKSETDQLIYRAAEILKDLSSDERNLLQRFYIEDQSLKTIADELGISEGAVRKRKFDVLKKLSKKISGGFLSFTGTL